MKITALAFIRLCAATIIGCSFYGVLGFSIDHIARALSDDSRLRQLLEWLLALIGPFGLGLILIIVFIVVAFLLLPRFVPVLHLGKRNF
ncbi:MAG: hypothetical protein ING21_05690 [Burkholderiales bacterium]|jgi:hypothetical protein|nr:hypothetical protein [Burkholderiales bacterium]MCA3163266.1 hypothetical protein [Burkholderiales bacterium]MCA3165978.1 hypothetical protein [Burkholderiales bacterium]MCA3173414.1 hypothetical protein [Burkholderiales bacterium]